MNDAYTLGQILWSSDPATQRAIWIVLGLVGICTAFIFLPLLVRLARLFSLERKLRALNQDGSSATAGTLIEDFKHLLVSSPIAGTYAEFERRWRTAELAEQAGRAPVRLIDIFDDRPLLPFGPRRSLLPVLPGLFLATGVFAALSGLIPSLAIGSAGDMTAEARTTWMAAQLGLALRAAAWGFLSAIAASLAARLIEGGFDARSHGLDDVVESAFGSVSPGELAEITRQTQQSSLDTLGKELSGFANELNERLDRGLQRIEQSTARSANLVSQEQRGALHSIVQELSLSVRQGVETHLGELRSALQRAVEHQNSVSGGLAETFQSMVENSKTQDQVARTLMDSARAVEDASRSMRSTSTEMEPVLAHLGNTSESLAKTADRIGDTQQVVARTAEGVRGSLELAASGVDDQRQFIELSLGEIRRALTGLGDGLGDSLQRSLREIDEVLGKSVGQLRETLEESNETIDRLSSPIRAAEGSSREIHLALDRVRGEVEVLGQWLNQASRPLRSGLADVEGRAEEISRSMGEFNNHARQIDKTMEALRHEIHEESRRIQGSGSELGRRLQQTAEAMELLESTTSDVARRSHVADADPLRTRERHWSPSPNSTDATDASEPKTSIRPGDSTSAKGTSAAAAGAAATPSSGDSASDISDPVRDAADADRQTPPDPSESTRVTAATQDQTRTDDRKQSASAEDAPRESLSSVFRVGAARAQGPDPYARFDENEDEPTNLRHFPTPDRELGQELKLSGLLGPRSEEDPPAPKTSRKKKRGKGRGGDRKGGAKGSASSEKD